MIEAKWGMPLLAASALLFGSAAAFAQAEEESPVQEITVTAPRPITTEVDESHPGGRTEAVISLKMTVQYADLDLSDPEDADRLMLRIKSVARDGCKYLDRLYPLNQDPDCMDRAVADTQPQADKAIVAAGG